MVTAFFYPLRAIVATQEQATWVGAVTTGRRLFAAVAATMLATCSTSAATTTGTTTPATSVDPFALFQSNLLTAYPCGMLPNLFKAHKQHTAMCALNWKQEGVDLFLGLKGIVAL